MNAPIPRSLHRRPPCQMAIGLCDALALRFSRAWSTFQLKWILRAFKCRYGRGLRADGPVIVRMDIPGSVELGNNVRMNSRFKANLVGLMSPNVLFCIAGGKISIGDDSGFSSAIFSSRASISVGKRMKIGGNVRIFDHDWHALDYRLRADKRTDSANAKSAPVVIEDDVFIGAQAIILRGVHIGARSIIGAGAVVSLKDIPPDSGVMDV